MSLKIAAATILYHPKSEIIGHILSYLDGVEEAFVFDNSEQVDPVIVRKIKDLPKVFYMENGTNLGVAKVLNMAATKALAGGYNWLLLMDQDSHFEPGMFSRAKDMLAKLKGSDIGICGPVFLTLQEKNNQVSILGEFSDVETAWTSGSLLNLETYTNIGPFLEKLFIDSVDHEYCYRLKKNGRRVVRMNTVYLQHSLGRLEEHRFLGKMFYTTNHSWKRRYFMTRNRLYVAFLYRKTMPRGFWGREICALLTESLKVLLLEEDRGRKMMAICLGVWDFIWGNFNRFVVMTL